MLRDDRGRVRDAIEAAREAIALLEGIEPAALKQDRMRALAVERLFTILGEALGRVSSEFQARHPAIPWREATGMRHRIVHAYDDVNLDVIWKTVRTALPPLVKQLEEALTTSEGA